MARKKKVAEAPKRILAWHFLKADMRSASGDDPAWSEGEERMLSGKVALCKYGYHSSPTPLDALSYRTGGVLCRVEVSEPTESDGDEHSYNRKSVSVSRKLLAFADITSVLCEFAVDCAERVLPHFEKKYPDDKRCRRCIEQTRAYLRGEIDVGELRKARAGVADAYAANGYASDAAYAAYTAAAAADVALYAAYAAAYAAADAAYAATDASATEKKWQAEHLEELLRAAHPHLFAFDAKAVAQ